jgi:hypothetical protein
MTMKPWLLLAPLLAIQDGPARAAGAPEGGVASRRGDLKWEVQPPRPGRSALLWGTPDGPHAELLMLPSKFRAPLHTHSSTVRRVVVSGVFRYGLEGQPEREYGPGSLIVTPAGLPHHDGCLKDCLVFAEWEGKFDTTPVK